MWFGIAEEQESLKDVRRRFEEGFYGVDDVVSSYHVWLSRIFYVVVSRFNLSKGDYEYAMFRGLKRGDNRYGFLTCSKFWRLGRFGEDLSYFNRSSHGVVRGSGLLATLEYDANRFSLPEAWSRVGVDFNRFMSHIRKLYGRVSIVRVWESHESGYPHIHVSLTFGDYAFNGRRMWNKRKGNWVFRVIGVEFKDLKGCWSQDRYGFSDFEMVDNFSGGIRYLAKYLAKSTSAKKAGVKGIRTLAMCWIFRKRSFGFSGDLFKVDESVSGEVAPDGMYSKSNSNSDVRYLKVGIDLYGNSIFEIVERWCLFGFCVREGVKWDDWRMHFVEGSKLKCVLENDFDIRRNRYDLLD